ncbi:hypothetical protein EW145_g1548 [Phellinidium pouzarii]|uniref:Potassium transporter n=1 Tax=Phellinidium pouzarii TaxID=167371 RepID=A0A4S4LFX1_9AGAM|nr:hypothetical protein EW145_g1548 [Phellinidium pouzarii]
MSKGIVYSDIGTSPLYVLNGIWPATGPAPSEEDVIGAISAIIWSLTLIPLLKYVLICPRFATKEGEGGTFALYHGLYPPSVHSVESDRTLTGDTYAFGSASSKSSSRISFLQKSRWPIMIWALFGTSLTMADGIFTPAVSVTSAVAGIAIAKPEVSGDVVPISIAFIVALFLVQRVGTARLGFIFAPITFIWLALLGVTVFVRTGDYDILGGILLALTGSEAMFASLGQFNASSIQIGFGGFVYPCLVFVYLGQGARLVKDGENIISNIFYLSIPGKANGPLFWILYVFAILATIIASQTMLTASFSLVQQVVNMRSLPRLRMCYTSETMQGQIYIPVVNYTLMIACVVIVVCFKNSTALTNAYGFSVATVMFATSVLIALQIRLVKRKPLVFALAFLLFFGFLDGLFWGASLRKVPNGAWVPLMIGLILATMMGLEDEFDGANRRNLRHFIMEDNDETFQLRSPPAAVETSSIVDVGEDTISNERTQAPTMYYMARPTMHRANSDEKGGSITQTSESVEEKRALVRIETCAVFHKLTPGSGIPHSFVGFIRQWPALPRVVIFLSVRVIPTARVGLEDRYQVTKVRSLRGFYGVTYCLGFRDEFEVKVDEVIRHICALETHIDPQGQTNTIDEIRYAAQTATHIVPHYHVVSKPVNVGYLSPIFTCIRMVLIEAVYRRISTMFPETGNWLGSADEIIRVGVNAVI